jgi:GxxExxY protein
MSDSETWPQSHEATKPASVTHTAALDLGLEKLGRQIIDCAFSVHKEMGAGLLESIYEECFVCELKERHIPFVRQQQVPVFYKGSMVSSDFRLDLIVDQKIIVELKAVENLHPVHTAQIISYLKLTNCRLGYLINFNTRLIKDGVRRVVL